MKQLYSIIALCCLSFCWFSQVNAQAPNCSGAIQSPFCSGIAQYPANSDGTGSGSGPQAPAGPNYDCLGTQGNPSYFSLTIEQTGLIDFTLDNTTNLDIDFILWGPFSSVAAAGLACDSMGQGNQWGDVADCSYLATGQEQVTIPAAQAGEVYILMVTNYTNTATNIFSTQNSGSGSIACPCEIPYTIDTTIAGIGNQGFLTDTTNGINQFVVCPNNTLGIQIGASGAFNDTISLYGPFTTINSAFPVNSVLALNTNAPTNYDSLTIFALLTPGEGEIGVNDFSIGLRNDLNTGGFTDSSCFDLLNIQVIVPGVRLSNRNVCSGASFAVAADSIPMTTLGSSSYAWSQISGPAVTFSSTTSRIPTITIPVTSSTSSNDSTIIVVDYNYGGLCPMSDTMVLYYPDMSVTATALPDSVCSGSSTNLLVNLSDTLTPAICDDYDVAIIPFAPLTTTGGTAVTTFTALSTFGASDEGVSAALPIGFDFDFYCNSFNTFYVHTNGFITFNPLAAGVGLLTGASLPTAGAPENVIALGWADLDAGNGSGNINYYVIGTAPNRQLVVNFNNVEDWLNFNGNTKMTTQAILNESDNSIEIHITSNTLTISTIGIENGNGTLGHYHASLNATQGQASGPITSVAYRFSPKVFGPFYSWTPAATLSANNVVSPVASPTATTTYSVAVEDGICTYSDSTTVYILSGLNTPTVACDSSDINSISFSWSDLGLPPTGFYEYSLDGGTTWINVGTLLSTTATGLLANTSYTILVRGNDGTGGTCPLSPTGTTNCSTVNPSCVNNPAINILLTPSNLLCNNDTSGCISAIVTGGSGGPMGLTWSTGATNMDTICNLIAGTYTLVARDAIVGGGIITDSTLYSETFDGVHNWTLNVSTGTNAGNNNFWTVGNGEAGQAVGDCGAAGGTNNSLHVTSAFFPGGGAAYDAGGLCPIVCVETNMRSESPAFSTIGESNLTFEFNYIAGGDALIDNASVVYNDGSGWQVLDPSIKSNTCIGGQGEWSKFTMALPASCDNQASVQVGFNWTNNDDGAGAGADPSVAIDSVLVFSTNLTWVTFECVDSQSITIVEPPVLVVTVDSVNNPFCSGSADGAIFTTTSGGTANYSYNWSNSDTTAAISNLNNGTFTITATDANGCTATNQATLTVPNPIIITIDNIANNSCAGTPDGSVAITATGGVGTLTYAWSNSATTEDLTAISNGTYILTVTDGNGCSDTAQAIVSPIVILSSTEVVVNPLCTGDNGSASLTVSGGTGSYTFDWGTASTSTTNSATIAAGQFVITITDSGNGCTGLDTVTLIDPTLLTVSLVNTTNIGCNTAANVGALDIQVLGGTPIYSYAWDNGATSEDLTGLTAGSYAVTVTDANGCSATSGSYAINAATAVSVNITTLTGNLACDLQPIGALNAVATGGTNITYSWSNNTTDSTATGLATGTYTVTVTNSDGCTDTAMQTINAPILPNLDAFVSVTGMTSISVPLNTSLTISAGSSSFDYNWTSIANPVTGNANIANATLSTTTVNPDPEGDFTYIVTASATTNDTTCSVTDTVWVTVEAPYQGIPSAFTPDGDGINDTFRPVMLADDEVTTFRIYNRWGQEVYNGDEAHGNGWDGTFKGVAQPTETYVYMIVYQKASDPAPKSAKGEFTLIR
jgi:gliding motility-associated-like protein